MEVQSTSGKAAWTFFADTRQVADMDYLDEAKVRVVDAMKALEDALTEGLPAQAPRSDADEVRQGILQMKRRIQEASERLSDAEAALKRL